MAQSLRSQLAELKRRRLGPDRLIDALLEVRSHTDEVLFTVGGLWDNHLKLYVEPPDDRPLVPHVVWLEEAQLDVGRAFARWLEAVRAGDMKRARLIMAGGARGSGKTWCLAGVFIVAIALEFPGDWQFGVNLTNPQRKECIEAIEEVAPARWIREQSDDLRDPFTQFITRSTVGWISAQNPKRLRQAKLRIRHVLLNEAQDQAEKNFFNAIGAIRNVGGLVSVATNKPSGEAGDWVAALWAAIEAGEVGHRGEVYELLNTLNTRVDQVALEDIGILIGAVSKEAADADMGRGMKISGSLAFKNFVALPMAKGGHIGDPPPKPMIGFGYWKDVTAERTAEKMNGGAGYDYIIGADWNKRPGIVGIACKLFEVVKEWPDGPRWKPTPDSAPVPLSVGTVVLWACDQINCAGDETAFAEVLERKGYTPHGKPVDGRRTFRSMIVGDGTGARQNAAHRWEDPASFKIMKDEGWLVLPPTKTKKGKPDNPLVKDSRAQMWDGFHRRQILVSPALKEPEEGFNSLIASLQRAKVTAKGALVDKGGYQHAPDPLRYVWWLFGTHREPPAPQGIDTKTFDALRAIRVLNA